jgi:hypothetical protein
MPCRDEGLADEIAYSLADLQKTKAKLDKVTALLCTQCKILIKYNKDNLMNEDVYKWYLSHKKEDEQRKEVVLQQIEKLNKQKEALQKSIED